MGAVSLCLGKSNAITAQGPVVRRALPVTGTPKHDLLMYCNGCRGEGRGALKDDLFRRSSLTRPWRERGRE